MLIGQRFYPLIGIYILLILELVITLDFMSFVKNNFYKGKKCCIYCNYISLTIIFLFETDFIVGYVLELQEALGIS